MTKMRITDKTPKIFDNNTLIYKMTIVPMVGTAISEGIIFLLTRGSTIATIITVIVPMIITIYIVLIVSK